MSGTEAEGEQVVGGQRAGEDNIAGEVPPPNAGRNVPWYKKPIRIYARSEEEVSWRDPSFWEGQRRRQFELQQRAADPRENEDQTREDGGGDVVENREAGGELPSMEGLAADQVTVERGSFGDPADKQDDGTDGKQRTTQGDLEEMVAEGRVGNTIDNGVPISDPPSWSSGSENTADLSRYNDLRKEIEELKKLLLENAKSEHLEEPIADLQLKSDTSPSKCPLSGLSAEEVKEQGSVEDSFENHGQKVGGIVERGAREGEYCDLEEPGSRQKEVEEGGASEGPASLDGNRDVTDRQDSYKNTDVPLAVQSSCNKNTGLSNSDKTGAGCSATLKTPDNDDMRTCTRSQKKLNKKKAAPFANWSSRLTRKNALVNPPLNSTPTSKPVTKKPRRKTRGQNHGIAAGGIVEREAREGEYCDLEEPGSRQKEVEEAEEGGASEDPASLDGNRDVTEGEGNHKNTDVLLVVQPSCNQATGLPKWNRTEAGCPGTSITSCVQNRRPFTRSQKKHKKKKAVPFAVPKCSSRPTRENALVNPLLNLTPTSEPVPKNGSRKARGQSESVEPNINAGTEGSGQISGSGIEMETITAGQMSAKKPQFPCPHCTKACTTKQGLKHHIDNIHKGYKKFVCEFCGWAFSQKLALDSHERSAHGVFRDKNPRAFTCEVCGKIFGSKENLQNHRRTHAQEKPYSCHLCSKRFMWRYQLEGHISSDHEGKKLKCEFCKSEFKLKCSLEYHQREKHLANTEEFTCTYCGKICYTPKGFQRHRKTYSCRCCPLEFPCYSKLKEHMQRDHPMHVKSGVTCVFCDKVFAIKGHLEQHMKGHTKEKAWICSVCDKELASKQGLGLHKKCAHKASGTNVNKGVAANRNPPAGSEHASEAGNEREAVVENPTENNTLSFEGTEIGSGFGGDSLLDQYQLGLVSSCDQVNNQVLIISATELKQLSGEEDQNLESDASVALARSDGSIPAEAPGLSIPHATAAQLAKASPNSRKRNAQLAKYEKVPVTKKRMENDASARLPRTTSGRAKSI